MNKIITISREFGSGGREIGRRLAEKMQIAYYDQEIVTELIKRTDLAEAYIHQIEDKRPVPLFPITTGRTFMPRPNPIMEQQLSIYIQESDIIREMAEKSDCIIVGRCADYVLREMNPFRLFIYADIDYKMERCRKRENAHERMTNRELRQHILSVDKHRSKYYEFFTEQKWGEKSNTDFPSSWNSNCKFSTLHVPNSASLLSAIR